METIYLGAGCFWCTEAVFKSLKGILSVMPGYMGGKVSNPTYEEVCEGNTGHIEVAKIEYDPSVLKIETLLKVFFDSHDPTTIDRQGADVGTQYRSAIFYTNENQKLAALEKIEELNKTMKILTEVREAITFYPAENYHRDYFANNPDKAYCQIVIAPKVEKLKQEYRDLLKD
jgi:peptide-methionine (S)-S-oxide reductase